MNVSNVNQGSQVAPPIAAQPRARPAPDAGKTAAAQPADSPSTVVTLSGARPPQSQDGTDETADSGQAKVKSFTYGALGLGKPKSDAEVKSETPEQQASDDYYTAGRVAAAALTIGTAIALLA